MYIISSSEKVNGWFVSVNERMQRNVHDVSEALRNGIDSCSIDYKSTEKVFRKALKKMGQKVYSTNYRASVKNGYDKDPDEYLKVLSEEYTDVRLHGLELYGNRREKLCTIPKHVLFGDVSVEANEDGNEERNMLVCKADLYEGIRESDLKCIDSINVNFPCGLVPIDGYIRNKLYVRVVFNQKGYGYDSFSIGNSIKAEVEGHTPNENYLSSVVFDLSEMADNFKTFSDAIYGINYRCDPDLRLKCKGAEIKDIREIFQGHKAIEVQA